MTEQHPRDDNWEIYGETHLQAFGRVKGLYEEQYRLNGLNYSEAKRLRAVNAELVAALDTIAGGYINRFPGAPDVMTAASPKEFRGAMWSWSQRVARAAIAKARNTSPGEWQRSNQT